MTVVAGRGVVCDVPMTLAPDIAENDWFLTGAQRNRVTFNGIWQGPYGLQVSGLYIYGDNGFNTAISGVDVWSVGSTGTAGSAGLAGGRRRMDGSIIPRNNFDLPSLHRVDARIQRRFALGPRVRLDGIVEVFNLFNRANYDPTLFVFNEANARFGQPNSSTTLAYSPRMLQFGFRTQF
jgi:hypothetical protein